VIRTYSGACSYWIGLDKPTYRRWVYVLPVLDMFYGDDRPNQSPSATLTRSGFTTKVPTVP